MKHAPEVIVEQDDKHVATVTLNRPDRLNALSNDLLEALASALDGLDQDGHVRCIVIAGADRAFAAGADIRALSEIDTITPYLEARTQSWAVIRGIQTPLVAAVSGYCLGGGCELAICCDVVVASESASFGLPETMLGLVPSAGGTQRMPRSIGRHKALDMILTGRTLSAAEAEAAGLVSRVVPADSWRAEAASVGRTIASRAPAAQILAKGLVNHAFDTSLERGYELEQIALRKAFESADARSGIEAFLEKRDPHWASS